MHRIPLICVRPGVRMIALCVAQSCVGMPRCWRGRHAVQAVARYFYLPQRTTNSFFGSLELSWRSRVRQPRLVLENAVDWQRLCYKR